MTRRAHLLFVAAAFVLAGCASSSPSRSGGHTSGSSGGGSSSFVMPNEVGLGLQAAQDDIQRVSGNPIFISRSTDATGAGRHQVLDRDWKVCTQRPAAGTNVAAHGDVSFGAVKLAESCP